MKLLVVVLCLLSERYLMHSLSSKRFIWFGDYCQLISNFMQKITGNKQFFANPWLGLTAIILPLIVTTSLIYIVFHSLLFGLIGFLLNLLIFFYCLGPDNPFYPVLQEGKKTSAQDTVSHYFARVMTELFAVVFWYVVAGPIAALTYRIIALCKDKNICTEAARQVTDILEWPVARVTAILFLLVGNFQRGYSLFLSYLLAKPALNAEMLSKCGMEALRAKDSDKVSMVAAEGLVEHATMVLLVCVALITMGAFL
jgi:AmpE protein